MVEFTSSRCLDCGACCAFFRVSFHWLETEPEDCLHVPKDLVEAVGDHLVCMRGTGERHGRCLALEGEIGKSVSCRIYGQRSSVCREFGHEAERCDRARAFHGLPPLTESV